MYLEFKKNNFNVSVNDLFLRKDNKTLKIFYGDTGDIYFDIFGERKRNANGINFATFTISREDDVYSYFEELFNDILEYHVYYSGDIIDEVDKSLNYELKKKNANSILVSNGTMELYSDSIYDEKANLLRISKVEESILLEFKIQVINMIILIYVLCVFLIAYNI